MKNKLKLILWGKGLELPVDYDNLDIKNYSKIEYYENRWGWEFYTIEIYLNSIFDEKIEIFYFYDGKQKQHEYHFYNGDKSGIQYEWDIDGNLINKEEYFRGKLLKKENNG